MIASLINPVTGDKSPRSPNVTFSCGLVKSTFFFSNKLNVKWRMDCIFAFYTGTPECRKPNETWMLLCTICCSQQCKCVRMLEVPCSCSFFPFPVPKRVGKERERAESRGCWLPFHTCLTATDVI